MKRLVLVIAAILAAGGCHRDLMPFLGKWSGGFYAKDSGPIQAHRARDWNMEGYLQVYANKQSFLMHLEGPQEAVDLTGKWVHTGRRLTLGVTGIKIDDKGGADQRDPNLVFIPSADLKAAYSRPLILDEAADKKSLLGLQTSIGKIIGQHSFKKDSF